MVTIKDDYGKEYNVLDLKRFKKHLLDYHSKNGKGDNKPLVVQYLIKMDRFQEQLSLSKVRTMVLLLILTGIFQSKPMREMF